MTDITPTHAHIQRLPNWEILFYQFMADTRANQLQLDWETHNCASWTCDGIQAITGEDLYAELRGKGSSPLTMYKAMRDVGFETVHDLVASKLLPTHRAFAKQGDVCLYPLDGEALYLGPSALLRGAAIGEGSSSFESLGMAHAVCLVEPPFAWALTASGLISLPITESCILFKVGE